jgi:hypothetical protein
MNLITATIPDDSAQLAGWLELQLRGNELGKLTAELAVIHRAGSPAGSVRALLGPRLEAVLSGGLKELPRDLLKQLLRQPAYLLELQELILLDGGAFWNKSSAPSTTIAAPTLVRHKGRWQSWLIGVLAATAACLAFLLADPAGWLRTRPRSQLHGWNRPEVLTAQVPPNTLLRNLADAAESDWLPTSPETPEQTLERIANIRQGCSKLFLADLSQLPEPQRQELKEKCRKWSAQFDQLRNDLEEKKDPAMVRGQLDALVRRMVQVLREQAENARAA